MLIYLSEFVVVVLLLSLQLSVMFLVQLLHLICMFIAHLIYLCLVSSVCLLECVQVILLSLGLVLLETLYLSAEVVVL